MGVSRRQDILDQAMEMVIENGLGELTMGKIAKRVGFTEPAMYRHFKNKQDLVINLVRRLGGGFEEVYAGIDQEARPDDFFPKYFHALLEYLRQVRGVTFLFLSESTYSKDQVIQQELLEIFQAQVGRIVAYLDGAAARGDVRTGVEPEAAALCFLGIVQALVTHSLLTNWDIETQVESRGVLDVFLKGVVG